MVRFRVRDDGRSRSSGYSDGRYMRIVSENYTNASSFDVSPDGTHTYGWEPLAGYVNPGVIQ